MTASLKNRFRPAFEVLEGRSLPSALVPHPGEVHHHPVHHRHPGHTVEVHHHDAGEAETHAGADDTGGRHTGGHA
jgi:hypothetical protein